MKRGKKHSRSLNSLQAEVAPSKMNPKSQGLPMYAIGVIIIGIIVLAIILVFVFGITGQGTGVLDKIFGTQSDVTASAQGAANSLTGSFIR